MKNSNKWLTAAAVILLLIVPAHLAGHFFGGSFRDDGSPRAAVEREMTRVQFDIGGAIRSYREMYQGFSLSYAFTILAWGLIVLVVARTQAPDGRLHRQVAAVSATLGLVMAWLSFHYFFLPPAAMLGASSAAAAVAVIRSPRR